MKEYEYSFKVESIEPYIKYVEENGYEKKSVETQNRIVYENKHSKNIISRITTKNKDGKKETTLDFKNVEKKKNNLNDSRESLPIKINKNNRKAIESILDVLDFYEAANNTRTRYVYEKGNVKFEIDDYIVPKMQVVAIEGKKEDVDSVYENLNKKIQSN